VLLLQRVREPSAAAAAAAADDDDDDGVHDVVHYWYCTWPDHTAPRAATHQLLQLVAEVERLRVNSTYTAARRFAPVIVHCRSLQTVDPRLDQLGAGL